MNTSNLWLLAVVAIAACDNTSSTGNGVIPIRVAGTWKDTVVVHSGQSDSCVVLATAVLNQNRNADSFTGNALGQQTCYGTMQGEPQTFYAAFTQGEITGAGIRFVDQSCVYIGIASGDPVNLISGSASCAGGSGTWRFVWAGPGTGST